MALPKGAYAQRCQFYPVIPLCFLLHLFFVICISFTILSHSEQNFNKYSVTSVFVFQPLLPTPASDIIRSFRVRIIFSFINIKNYLSTINKQIYIMAERSEFFKMFVGCIFLNQVDIKKLLKLFRK